MGTGVQVQQTGTADSMVRFGRFYGRIWQISADLVVYKYRQTLWSDLADFGRLQVRADSMVRFGRFRQIWWFTSTAVDFMIYSGRFGGLQA